jgi:hypothetical protein
MQKFCTPLQQHLETFCSLFRGGVSYDGLYGSSIWVLLCTLWQLVPASDGASDGEVGQYRVATSLCGETTQYISWPRDCLQVNA